MKKILLSTLLIFTLVLILASIASNSRAITFNTNGKNNTGNIQFVFDHTSNAGEMNKSNVRLKIVDSASNQVVYHNVVKLTPEKRGFITPVISLKNGSYKVIEFSVQSEDSKANSKDNESFILPALFTIN